MSEEGCAGTLVMAVMTVIVLEAAVREGGWPVVAFCLGSLVIIGSTLVLLEWIGYLKKRPRGPTKPGPWDG